MDKSRVLIVDDDVSLGRTLALILDRKGYEVVTVEDGAHAVEEARREPFDLILMDVIMPGQSGVETLRELKAVAPQARVVMMTGHAVAGMVTEAVQIGVDGVLYKPFNVEVVLDTLMSADVLRPYEGYLQTVWDRVAPIVGQTAAQAVFRRALASCVEAEGSLLGRVEVTERGISLAGLRRELVAEPGHRLDPGQLAELRRQLQGLLAAVFDILGLLSGNILTDPLIQQLSDQLKGGRILWPANRAS